MIKKTLPVVIAGIALVGAAVAIRTRARAEAHAIRPARVAHHGEERSPGPVLPRSTTQIRPGTEKDLGRAARDVVIRDLVSNLKLAIERKDTNTERALREGLEKYGEDGRVALEREGLR